MYHEFDKGSKGQQHSLAAMRERRHRPQQDNPMRPDSRYPCFMHDGHPVAETEQGMILLDTGVTQSFGNEPTLRLFGRNYPLASNYMGQSIEEIGKLVGIRLFALIGADVLNEFPWTLDMSRGEFRQMPNRELCQGITIPLEYFMSIPTITGELARGPRRFFFDTCARISYLKREELGDIRPSGEAVDFFPGFGPFRTQIYDMQLQLVGVTLTMQFGILPPTLEGVLNLANVSGIIGASLLDQYRIHYSAADKTMCLLQFGSRKVQ